MAFTDYKFWFVRRDDAGKIIEVAVRFYEGDYQNVLDPVSGESQLTYVRTAKLGANDVPQTLKGRPMVDSASAYAHKYTPVDFGDISTDDELRTFCDSEIAKSIGRTVIPEQRAK